MRIRVVVMAVSRYAVLIVSTAATTCGSASESSVITAACLRPIRRGEIGGSALE
jgi:hypothetical protein